MVVTSECNLCGKDYPRLNHTKIEGAIIETCDKCSNFGIKINTVQEPAYTSGKKSFVITDLENDFELVPEYGKLIAKARQNKGLTRYELAKCLNEKESIIRRIEEEELNPDEELIKRIENFLGIRLREKYEEIRRREKEKKIIKLTVGDVVEIS